MSLVDDRNKAANEQHMQECLGSYQAHLEEMEAHRVESEKYSNPKCAEFWARKRAQVTKLRNKKVLLS